MNEDLLEAYMRGLEQENEIIEDEYYFNEWEGENLGY